MASDSVCAQWCSTVSRHVRAKRSLLSCDRERLTCAIKADFQCNTHVCDVIAWKWPDKKNKMAETIQLSHTLDVVISVLALQVLSFRICVFGVKELCWSRMKRFVCFASNLVASWYKATTVELRGFIWTKALLWRHLASKELFWNGSSSLAWF